METTKSTLRVIRYAKGVLQQHVNYTKNEWQE